MYDLLIVGAGLTAATLVARLRELRWRICVLDCRAHLGGNCHDRPADGAHIHQYGPHIFHSPDPLITEFLGRFTEWTAYTHTVLAEVEFDGELKHVPFPYCRRTAATLGRHLGPSEIIDTFFRGYSQKMWGMPWEQIPPTVRARVPMDTEDCPRYHRDSFVALPRHGYTRMLENMLDGAEIILNADPLDWMRIRASVVVYTGRPDLIPVPGRRGCFAETQDLRLGFRTSDIQFANEESAEAACLHACSLKRPWTRKTYFSRFTGGRTCLASTETPREALPDELDPFYPIETVVNQRRLARLMSLIQCAYPKLHLAGRLGRYRYLDMHEAVGRALTLAEELVAEYAMVPSRTRAR